MTAACCAILVIAVGASFMWGIRNEFVHWDDTGNYMTNTHIRGFEAEHLNWMWNATLLGVWQPLAWFLTAIEYKLLGSPNMSTQAGLDHFRTGIHAFSVAVHALSTVLCFFVARRLLALSMPAQAARRTSDLDVAALVTALLFGVHPLRAEVVAWASGQPYVFAMAPTLAAVLAYLRAVERRSVLWHVATGLLLAASQMCKAMAVPMVAVLFVLDFYPLRRFGPEAGWKRMWPVLLEKLPYAAVTLLVAYKTIHATTSTKTYDDDPVAEVYLVACYCVLFYCWMTFVPLGIAPYYMRPLPFNMGDPLFIAAGIAAPLITVAALVLHRRAPWFGAAWAACVLVLLPVIGIVQHGGQMAADRYTYLSCIPWALLVGGGLLKLFGAVDDKLADLRRTSLLAVAGLAAAGLGTMSAFQSRVWKDSESVWTAMVTRNPRFHMGFYNLAAAKNRNGKPDEAITCYQEAIRLNTLYPEAHVNLGNIYRRRGELQKAVDHYLKALQGRPNFHMALMNLADVYEQMGRADEAVQSLETARDEARNSNERDDRETRPQQIEDRITAILLRFGRGDEAERRILADLAAAEQIPDPQARADRRLILDDRLTELYAGLGRLDQAAARLNQAIAEARQWPDGPTRRARLDLLEARLRDVQRPRQP